MINLAQPYEKIKKVSSANVLVKTLLDLGVDSIFGYPGASVLSIYNELSQTREIKHYLVRHEQAAVHAAEGYARVSGKTGVVLVTSGPGFTNTITGMANAYADSTPLVILAGDVSDTNKEGKFFQKVDIETMSKPCSKKTFLLSKNDDIESVIKNAFKEAETGVKGPVVVALPRNLLEHKYTKPENSNIEIIPEENSNLSQQINSLKDMINSSKKPLILIGGGSINSSKEIAEFVSHTNIPVVSTLMGIGIFPSENNLYLGMIGSNGVEHANCALKQCDLLIALGVAFSDRSTCKKNDFAKNCKVISINIKPIKHQKIEYEINYDVKKLFTECNKNNNIFIKHPVWFTKQNQPIKLVQKNKTGQCLQSSYVLQTLSEYTKNIEPIVVTDVGQHQMLTAQFFKFNKPRKFITSGGLGTMGFGLPAAIGAQIASPENLILNITGDGSFQMNLQELATCREHHIPVKIVIMNNSYLGMVRQMQEKFYNNRYQVEMINPDFTKIAEAYDLFAVRVSSKEELIPALDRAIMHKGTAIVDIAINSFENI